MVVLPVSAEDGYPISEPEIITRGFIYVKESEDLIRELKGIALDAAESVRGRRSRDTGEWSQKQDNAVSQSVQNIQNQIVTIADLINHPQPNREHVEEE